MGRKFATADGSLRSIVSNLEFNFAVLSTDETDSYAGAAVIERRMERPSARSAEDWFGNGVSEESGGEWRRVEEREDRCYLFRCECYLYSYYW